MTPPALLTCMLSASSDNAEVRSAIQSESFRAFMGPDDLHIPCSCGIKVCRSRSIQDCHPRVLHSLV